VTANNDKMTVLKSFFDMDERKRLILNIIIQEHIATGQPVASNAVVEKYHVPLSSATVRNEMAALEEEGWIIQPYTSAGRVPTEKAYKQYITEIVETPVPKKESDLMTAAVPRDETHAKQLAKQLAQMTGLAVVWAFEKDNVYYTGVSNLMADPEFNVSSIIDNIDDIVRDIFESVEFTPQVLIGRSSPFGDFSGTIVSRYKTNDQVGLVGLVGPMHMDYAANRSRE
jgi:heat-inducible transcriptional repressor